MGDIGIRSRLRNDRAPASPPQFLPNVTRKCNGVDSALKPPSIRPLAKDKPRKIESESQPGPDTEDDGNGRLTNGYNIKDQKHNNLLQLTPDWKEHSVNKEFVDKKVEVWYTKRWCLGLAIVISVLVLLVGLAYTAYFVKHRTLDDIENIINQGLNTLRSETTQDKKFWRSLYSGLTTVTEAAPRQPLVLLMAVPLDASLTAVCLAHHITDIVSQAFGDPAVVKHNTVSHLQMPWDEHKLTLDRHLQHLSESHTAIIYNFEELPPKSATLLHGYFDNDNAPYKRAMIVMLLELELPYSSVSEAHLDLTVERRLHELWRQDLDKDNIPGLISRVAVLPLLVKPESKFVLQKLCPL